VDERYRRIDGSWLLYAVLHNVFVELFCMFWSVYHQIPYSVEIIMNLALISVHITLTFYLFILIVSD